MDRLMVLRLEVQGCEAEARFNGVPLLRATPQQPVALLPVHEFTLMGANELALVVQPGPAGQAAAPPPESDAPLLDPAALDNIRSIDEDGSVLAEVPVMLAVVAVVNRRKLWYGESLGAGC